MEITDQNVKNVIIGASIILHAEPDTPLIATLERACAAERLSSDQIVLAIEALKIAQQEACPGCTEPIESWDSTKTRAVLEQILDRRGRR